MKPLVFIVGPTASGKTSLSIALAKQFGGEIICADSRTIYKGMDIGTAKPTKQEREQVPHWGLDLVEPGQSFSAADFKQYTLTKIEEIRSRGHVPFIVGGSGLYIDGILFDYQFGPSPDVEIRQKLNTMTIEELTDYCNNNNVYLPTNNKNKRHLIRAIEQGGINQQRRNEPIDAIIVGITTEKEELLARIDVRTEQLLHDGVVKEANRLGKKYGWDSNGMTGNIYPILHEYLDKKIDLAEVKRRFASADWQLAKRQLTWFRRNPFIVWLDRDLAKDYIVERLA